MTQRPPDGPFWYRRAVGEPRHWRSVGERQRDFLIEQGLKPHHTVLDLGCGALRAGTRLIPYLETGKYYGLDNCRDLLEAGWQGEVVDMGRLKKKPTKILTDSFELPDVLFDYVIAQSLFTHLTREQIEDCIEKVLKNLKGKFFATFNVSPNNEEQPGGPHEWRNELFATRYPFKMFEEICENLGARVEFIGQWGHPKYAKKQFLQRMMVITHKRDIRKIRPLKDAVTTMVLYHPARPLKCLCNALRSLNGATKLPHRVEIIVQGNVEALPRKKDYPNLDIVFFRKRGNAGTGPRLREAVERFLKSDHKWFCKCDDDMTFPAGGWDHLIAIHEKEKELGEYRLGCAMLAVPKRMWAGIPRLFEVLDRKDNLPVLKWEIAHYENREIKGGPRWYVCDFADHGCTMFSRDVFESGILPDPTYFAGGNDFDLCQQMLRGGFKSALCIRPRSGHHHQGCKPGKYKKIRYNPLHTNASGEHFMEKWGFEIPMLTTFGGFQKTRWDGKAQRFVKR